MSCARRAHACPARVMLCVEVSAASPLSLSTSTTSPRSGPLSSDDDGKTHGARGAALTIACGTAVRRPHEPLDARGRCSHEYASQGTRLCRPGTLRPAFDGGGRAEQIGPRLLLALYSSHAGASARQKLARAGAAWQRGVELGPPTRGGARPPSAPIRMRANRQQPYARCKARPVYPTVVLWRRPRQPRRAKRR
jgi:hypothetical protein